MTWGACDGERTGAIGARDGRKDVVNTTVGFVTTKYVDANEYCNELLYEIDNVRRTVLNAELCKLALIPLAIVLLYERAVMVDG